MMIMNDELRRIWNEPYRYFKVTAAFAWSDGRIHRNTIRPTDTFQAESSRYDADAHSYHRHKTALKRNVAAESGEPLSCRYVFD